MWDSLLALFSEENPKGFIADNQTLIILEAFGDYMQTIKDNIAIYDVLKLPHPKEAILSALIESYRNTQEIEHRNLLETGLLLLSRHHEDVGNYPISAGLMVDDLDLPSMKSGDMQSIKDQYSKLKEQVQPERFAELHQISQTEYQRYLKRANAE